MSESYGGGTAGAAGTGPQQPSGTIETAKQEAAGVKDTAAEQAGSVVETAKSEVGAVAHEAKNQVRDLYEQTRTELKDQAAVQQRRVADGLRSVSGEFSSMADNSDGGVGADIVRQVSSRVDGIASWIGDRDPGALLGEVKSYARRKPGTFIAVAALAGLVAGRLTRALTESAKDDSGSTGTTGSATGGYGGTSGYAGGASGYAGGTSTGSAVPADGAYTAGGFAGDAGTAGAYSGTIGAGAVGGSAGLAGSTGVGDQWQGDTADAAIPPAPDGVSGDDVDGGFADDGSDTPIYGQTDAARGSLGEERP